MTGDRAGRLACDHADEGKDGGDGSERQVERDELVSPVVQLERQLVLRGLHVLVQRRQARDQKIHLRG